MLNLKNWEKIFQEKIRSTSCGDDPAHDCLHVCRVAHTALKLAEEERAKLEVVLPAAYFHDFINVPKNDPRRKEASKLSAQAAIEYLKSINYPNEYFDEIAHAITTHSFSANITPETLEAKIVQDADRLDGIGAIGIARCFSTTALMKKPYYCLEDVWAENRELDDKEFGIDHFFIKLFKTAETMHTPSARKEAQKRTTFMSAYLNELKGEI